MEDITLNNEQIEFHKARVFDKHPEVKLIEPCKIGDGIVHFLLVQRENLIQKFANSEVSSTFFIPASGSGSRMFQFLYNFLDQPNEDNRGQVEKFLNNMEEFAFFQKLPMEIKKKLKSHNVNLDEFVAFLLNSDGMAYGELPKGLIPFHKNGPFVLNPFQEQILQGIKVNEEHGKFHYTVNPAHQETISRNIKSTEELSGRKYDVSFSIQNKDTDAIAFDRDQNVKTLEDGSILKRPAGHGALLENLNAIDSDVIFIKNIDNIQHYQKSKEASETWKYLGGVALWFREEQLRILKNPNLEEVLELNRTFQFLSKQEIENIKTSWNNIGKVPREKLSINTEFNKTLREKMKLNKIHDYNLKEEGLSENQLTDKARKIKNQIADLEAEIVKMETNLGFFSKPTRDNPLLKETFDKIDDKKAQLESMKQSLHSILAGENQ